MMVRFKMSIYFCCTVYLLIFPCPILPLQRGQTMTDHNNWMTHGSLDPNSKSVCSRSTPKRPTRSDMTVRCLPLVHFLFLWSKSEHTQRSTRT
ncbi:hypothetical protein P692DRAFT_20545924 [Suillus brevipes Sb2]|nr:hypothetical protein P692DRAFT_20545924 [Suillus brevipes Sb2]